MFSFLHECVLNNATDAWVDTGTFALVKSDLKNRIGKDLSIDLSISPPSLFRDNVIEPQVHMVVLTIIVSIISVKDPHTQEHAGSPQINTSSWARKKRGIVFPDCPAHV